MLNLRELVDIFLGRIPMDTFAGRRIALPAGAITYAIAFVVVAVFIAIEAFIFRVGLFFLNKEPLGAFVLSLGLMILAVIVLIPIALIGSLVCTYIWGAVHYFLARFFSNKPGSLNDFNGSFLTLFGSIKLAEGIVFLVPVLGWIAACIIQLYGLFLDFKFVKSKFNLTEAQAAIVVLLPVVIVLGILVFIAFAVSFALIGTRLF